MPNPGGRRGGALLALKKKGKRNGRFAFVFCCVDVLFFARRLEAEGGWGGGGWRVSGSVVLVLLEWVCGEVTEEGGIVTGSCGFLREDLSGEKGGGTEEKLFLRWLGRSAGRARARSGRKKS